MAACVGEPSLVIARLTGRAKHRPRDYAAPVVLDARFAGMTSGTGPAPELDRAKPAPL